ncbi:MAG: winged helix-turn-helix transcriptional regulator [Rhodothermales bacterium]|nr:winged helix-turn-helix transcriptional regulator [Rhodothermales bacterium]
MHAWASLVRVSGNLVARVEADLRRAKLPPLAQYDALLELHRAGVKGLRPFELQHEMLLAQYNVSRLIVRLVNAGLVERMASEDDGRGQLLRITMNGKELLKRMWPVYASAINRHFGHRLEPAEIISLAAILDKLREDQL